jgi:hypothetical protein
MNLNLNNGPEQGEKKKNIPVARKRGRAAAGCERAAAALRCQCYTSYPHWLYLIAVQGAPTV